jgi:hypothetical protein
LCRRFDPAPHHKIGIQNVSKAFKSLILKAFVILAISDLCILFHTSGELFGEQNFSSESPKTKRKKRKYFFTHYRRSATQSKSLCKSYKVFRIECPSIDVITNRDVILKGKWKKRRLFLRCKLARMTSLYTNMASYSFYIRPE